ncbi:MAG: DinB family protein [Pseudoclavibacter sp.]|nr:DinB family protein [Pseudoclavibacter sp.]
MGSIDEQGRPEPPERGNEFETLLGFLEFHRATLAWKTGSLDDEQLRRTLPPSRMTLGGMLKHLAFVEDYWFGVRLAGQEPFGLFARVDWRAAPDWEWESASRDTGARLRELWRQRVERSREILAEIRTRLGDAALAETFSPPGGSSASLSLRWVLVHMVEEYARHNGHADLLREAIDGQTGE